MIGADLMTFAGNHVRDYLGSHADKVLDCRQDTTLGIVAASGVLEAVRLDLTLRKGISLLMNNGSSVARMESEAGDQSTARAILPGCVIPLAKNDRLVTKLNRPLHLLYVEISDDFIISSIGKPGRIDFPPSTYGVRTQLTDRFYMHAMRSIWKELGRNDTHRSLLIRGAATSLLGCVLSHWDSEKSGSKSTLCADAIVQIVEMVDDELESGISIAHVARHFDHSKAQFQKNFKAAFGKTFKQYVVERRVLKAKQKIIDTNDSFAHIAVDCGFYDQAHMIHTFRRQIGCTPGRLRREA
ncbi:helix-turn-helix transcriptional regulator [Yoonia sp. R2-816]|uniref:helix-turn-helix transcriptional regulator n=1 Tax=Yoonia sp. R2-816 TaxID=3342638 RepID=UPI00372BD434